MDELYVNIDDPSQKRRVLLQSSRDLLSALKLLDDFLDIKQQKRELFNKVTSIFDNIAVLNENLFSKLPKTGGKVPEKIPSLTKLKIKEPVKIGAEKTKLDILEEELSAIEDKLGRLK